MPNVRGRADPVNGGGDTNELKIYTFARTLAHALACVWSRRMPDSLRVAVVSLALFERPPGADEARKAGTARVIQMRSYFAERQIQKKKKKKCAKMKTNTDMTIFWSEGPL